MYHENFKKMVTYFNRKDLVSFGSYLLSEQRKSRFVESYKKSVQSGMNPVPVEESLTMVYHADIENWMDEQRSSKA